jgi:HPt (histidine-containing phosphotransfer) domain-containing protein
MRKGKLNAVVKRLREVNSQLEQLRAQLTTNTVKDFQSEFRYENWRQRLQKLIRELENERSILQEPGEYAELPIAVVADELGLSVTQVNLLIDSGELESTGRSPHHRVQRQELERVCDVGAAQLLSQAEKDASTIFKEAIAYLQADDLEMVEVCYRKIEVRDVHPRAYEIPLQIAIDLARGEFEKVRLGFEYLNEQEPIEREMIIANLSQALGGTKFKDSVSHRMAERILSESGLTVWRTEELGYEKEHELQDLTAYLTAVVYKTTKRFCRFNLSDQQSSKLMNLVRDAIYTALYASETYEISVASRTFVDKTRHGISIKTKRARLRLLATLKKMK